jgi:hypothetical protein
MRFRRGYSLSAIPLLVLPLITWTLLAEEIPTYTVVIDPGHGGAVTKRKDDKWDPVTRAYLDTYIPGMEYKSISEEEVVLKLGKAVHGYIALTESDEGWRQFREILKEFSGQKEFPRIVLKSHLSREDSWSNISSDPETPEINARYRHFDYPDSSGRMMPGRISFINSLKPYLVVSLHLNPAGRGNSGGMAAVISPGYPTFELMRKVTLGEVSKKEFYKLRWADDWLIAEDGWSKYESARADTWVYFHGYRTVQKKMEPWREKNRGIRSNLITWRYAENPGWEEIARKNEPGPYSLDYRAFKAEGRFWDRERGVAEVWRREGGPLGYGGDNHYASDELLRFVQFGIRVSNQKGRGKSTPGPIRPPFVSTYGLPTLVNAINAYLEIGHLNRERDRNLIMQRTDDVAKSIAVGIYSLFRGLKLRSGYASFRPSGKSLDFAKYENMKEGNYFKIVTE